MRGALPRAARWLGWALLWGAAAVGVSLLAVTIFAALPATRPIIAAALVHRIDDAIAGSLSMEGIGVLPHGGVELRGVRVFDPDGRLVLRVDRARVLADAARILGRELGVSLELDGVEVDAALRTEDGSLALARAFAPSRPPSAIPTAGGKGEGSAGGAVRAEGEHAVSGGGWTLRVGRLSIRRGQIRTEGAAAQPIEVSGLSLDARGLWAPQDGWVEVRLDGTMSSPASAPLTIELRAQRRGGTIGLQRFAVALGDDRLEAVGDGDLARRTGRLALTRLGVSQREAGTLARAAKLGGDLSGTVYAESDGTTATVALTVAPAAAEATGRAQVAFAVRLPPAAFAWGVSADVDRLDPSRLTLLAPPGSVTLQGRGAARGGQLADMAGRIVLNVERSRLREGELGPISLSAIAGDGAIEIARLEAVAPGGEVGGRLRWQEGRAVEGQLTVAFADLERFGQNLGQLLGRRLPPVEGSGRAEVSLSGSSSAPRIVAAVEAPRLAFGGLRTEGARLKFVLEGPDAELSFAANVAGLGPDPIRTDLRGRFGPERRSFELADLVIAWPGIRFELAGPARLDLVDPAVDSLVLVAGAQRVELHGGVRRAKAVEAQLRLVAIDLARLPQGLFPPGLALAGLLNVDARASGTRVAPRVEATVGLTGGSAYEVGGLQLLGDLTWDGELERIEADLGLVRERGGAIDLSLDLPVALGRARPYEAIRLELRGKAVPLDEIVWMAGSYALVSGDVDLSASLSGSVGVPELRIGTQVRNGTYEDLEELAADAMLDATGGRVRLRASGAISGKPAVTAEAEFSLDLPRLLVRPRDAVAAAIRSPAKLSLRLPDVALKPLAGRLELPADLSGRVEAAAELGGSLSAPRGTAWLSVAGGAGWGVREVGGRLEVALAPERSGATLDLRLAEKPAARLDGRIDLPVERLFERRALTGAPVKLDVALPANALKAWGGDVISLGGTVEGRGALHGSLGAPQWELALSAADVVVEGHPLGAVRLDGKYSASRTTALVDLRPLAGGTLYGEFALDRQLGMGAAPGPIREAPVDASLRAERLDLGFLPALAPGVIRAASGAASVELHAAGPLFELRPHGTIRVANGRLAVAELGDWTGATIEADLGEDTVELRRFDVRKGKGRLELHGTLRGLSKPDVPAELELTLKTDDFGVERAGMEFVKLDLEAEGRGTLTRSGLTLGLVVPQAEVKLPRRIPRTLQEVTTRKDISVGRPKPTRVRRVPQGPTSAPAPGATSEPFKTVLHVVAPRRLRVRADQPRIDVELKADAILTFVGSRSDATGAIQAIRGQAEPIGGRVFVLDRGKVTFTGGPVTAGALDVAARYDNPKAVIWANITGTIAKPRLQLTSAPPLEEAQIAILIATGRTELKAGVGGVNTLAAGDAGLAAAGAVAMGVFKDLLADKLPVDSVSLDSTAVSAGKYINDRVYVGYSRRFDAKPEKGENPDEVRVEYQLAPGWQVETRYGSGQSGGVSIVWTRIY